MTNAEKAEFIGIVLEATETGDKTRLAEFWRKRFPGYKWWLLGPNFSFILPDDGKVEHYHSMTLPPTATPETPSVDELMREIVGWCED